MFSKENSNTGGECLCETCLYCSRHVRVRNSDTMAECKKFKDIYFNVGVCKHYVEKRL